MTERFDLPAMVNHENVQAILEQGLSVLGKLSDGDRFSVDCSNLTHFDSSALSLVMGLVREAQKKSATVTLEKFPEKLASLAQVYGVAELVVA